jgi:glycosyltransferase involved in cell wall biosynthesis
MIASAHIIGGEALGGAELFYTRLVNALRARHHPPLAITVADSRISARLDPQIPQIHVPMWGVADLPSRWRIGRALRAHRPEIVQTYMGRATRLTRIAPGGRPIHVARLGGYYTPHGYRHAHAWIAASPGIREHLLRHGFPADRIFHIGNFVAPHRPSPATTLGQLRHDLALPEDALIVTAVGRLHPVKGFDALLEAFARVAPRINGRPVYLIVVGDGPLATKLSRHAEQLGIGRQVRWPGWRDDAGRFQELADLCVCTSRQEGLGNVILEAWARERAVLSTRAQGPTNIISDRENGWLVPVDHPADLASAMELLLRDDSLRRQLAANGNRALLAHYGEEAIVDAYLDCYATLLRGR